MNDSWSNLGSEAKNKGLSIEVLCFLFVSVGNKLILPFGQTD